MSHDVLVRPPAELADAHATAAHRRAPAVLQRQDDDFLAAVLASLGSANERQALRSSLAQARQGSGATALRKLFQPVQRQFHVALIEAVCNRPGEPRLDPARVESAGLVVRRLRPNGYEGWMRTQGRLRGWLAVDRLGAATADPQAALRVQHGATGVESLDRALRTLNAASDASLLDEHVVPMFLAPPDVCRAAGKTLFYGLVPTTSSESASAPTSLAAATGAGAIPFGAQDAAFIEHLMQPLRGEAKSLPRAGQRPDASWLDASDTRSFVDLLRQLALEFDVLGDHDEGRALRAVLHQIHLPLVDDGPVFIALRQDPPHLKADEFVAAAIAAVFEGNTNAAPQMPLRWPALGAALRTQLLEALSASLHKRFADVKAGAGRFDEPNARYALRAFVREKPDGICPGRVHWSDYSEPFVIAPWYEGAGAPPVQVALPDVSELKGLKPNVAFIVPPSLQGLMGGKLKDLLDGTKPPEGGITWICSFSLPIITICAFIVLNIFLTLFNLVFQWMLYIKVCIPFPKGPKAS